MFGGARTVGGLLLRNQLRREAIRGVATVSGGVAGFAAARAMKRSRSRYSSDMGGRQLFKRRRVMRRGKKKLYQRARRVRFNTRRRTTTTQPQLSEEIRQRIKQGRVPKRIVDSRVLRSSVTPYVLNFKGLDKEFKRSGPGFYQCGRQLSAGVAAWPVYCFNLTSILQGTAIASVTPFHRLESDSLGRYYWSIQNGLNNSGAISQNLQVRTSTNVTSTGLFSPKAVLDWVRLRFVLFCPTKRPITYRVRIVQLPDEELTPEFLTNATAAGGLSSNNEWANYVRQLTSNPIATSGRVTDRFKVLASRVFSLEPGQTDDEDPNPPRRIVDWFYKMGRVVNFYHTRDVSAVANTVTVDGTTNQAVTGSGNLLSTPFDSKQRVYMMIDCGAYEGFGVSDAAQATFDPVKHGSFDMNVELGYKTVDQS